MAPLLKTERTYLTIPTVEFSKQIAQFMVNNREHFQNSMPKQTEEFYTKRFWDSKLESNLEESIQDKAYRFFVFSKENDQIIGCVNFTSVQRGPYQGCFLGYSLDKNFVNKGYITEALSVAIDFMFYDKNLKKINANYMPSNLASGRVLEKLGFEKIGLAKEELCLNGIWQDHIAMRLINPNKNS